MHTLKSIRALLGVTQRELGAGVGCSQGNIGNYETGQSLPVPVALRLIDFAANRGMSLCLDQIYGRLPLPPAAQIAEA